MHVIPDFKASTLIPLLTRNIAPDSTIYTDALKRFDGLKKAGFQHVTRIQPLRSELRKGAKSAVPLADRAIGNLQPWLIGTYHGVSQGQLQVNLDEFVFRHNSPEDTRRFSDSPWSRNRPEINRVRADSESEGSEPQQIGAC
jgi:transposase-like protein